MEWKKGKPETSKDVLIHVYRPPYYSKNSFSMVDRSVDGKILREEHEFVVAAYYDADEDSFEFEGPDGPDKIEGSFLVEAGKNTCYAEEVVEWCDFPDYTPVKKEFEALNGKIRVNRKDVAELYDRVDHYTNAVAGFPVWGISPTGELQDNIWEFNETFVVELKTEEEYEAIVQYLTNVYINDDNKTVMSPVGDGFSGAGRYCVKFHEDQTSDRGYERGFFSIKEWGKNR